MREKNFDAFRAEVLALYETSRAPATTTKMRQVLREFIGLGGIATTGDLTPVNVARFAAASGARGRHPHTTRGLLSYLRRCCTYARAMGYLEVSPFDVWKGWTPEPAEEAGEPAHHPMGRIAAVLGHLEGRAGEGWKDHRLYALAALVAYTGLRRDEALFLRVGDVDLVERVVKVVPHAGRRLKRPTARREVPIPEELAPILAAWLPRAGQGGWVFPNASGTNAWTGGLAGYRPTDRLKQAGAAVGVEGFTFASLRHSFATHAATAWGLAPLVLKSIMGHTDLKTTLRYYVHADRRNLAAAVKAVGFSRPAA